MSISDVICLPENNRHFDFDYINNLSNGYHKDRVTFILQLNNVEFGAKLGPVDRSCLTF